MRIAFVTLTDEGTTLTERNDRSKRFVPESAELVGIEQLVGRCTARRRASDPRSSSRQPLPDWLTEPFVVRVRERLRQFVGHWKAAPYGGATGSRSEGPRGV
jgi:hypothetical protein